MVERMVEERSERGTSERRIGIVTGGGERGP